MPCAICLHCFPWPGPVSQMVKQGHIWSLNWLRLPAGLHCGFLGLQLCFCVWVQNSPPGLSRCGGRTPRSTAGTSLSEILKALLQGRDPSNKGLLICKPLLSSAVPESSLSQDQSTLWGQNSWLRPVHSSCFEYSLRFLGWICGHCWWQKTCDEGW